MNIQRVTSHNNRADIYTKCVRSLVLERHLRHNGIIELHIEEGEMNYFHILELAEQYFHATSDEDVKHTKERRKKMKDNNEYIKGRLRRQQKLNKQIKQLYLNKQKKDNKKLYIEDRSHQAQQREAHLDHMMEEYRNDLGDD